MDDKIIIYTDGSCLNNPGPGGIGIIMIWKYHRKEISKGYRKSTNNRMELSAVIEALKTLKRTDLDIIIYSDSQYVVNSIQNKWVFKWNKIGFRGKKNVDLWIQFISLYKKFNVEFKWVKAHVGNTENERCDVLAKLAAKNPTEIDTEYEKINKL